MNRDFCHLLSIHNRPQLEVHGNEGSRHGKSHCECDLNLRPRVGDESSRAGVSMQMHTSQRRPTEELNPREGAPRTQKFSCDAALSRIPPLLLQQEQLQLAGASFREKSALGS